MLPKPDRLYLVKDKAQDIFVDFHRPIAQHQIDGIRFLYCQYKKKTLGVILNDPAGYGKCLQVVLFLNALRPVLEKPVLILSNFVDEWKEHFEQWTDLSEELAIESSNQFLKKLVFVNRVHDGLTLGRREWSVVVLHDRACTADLLRTSFRADYKVWLTAHNLKENLHTLSSIYEWLHPNQRFKVEEFTGNVYSIKDKVEKAIMLDACLEDFLLRRSGFGTPFKTQQSIPVTLPVTTRKNKDPTGSKVKRSKRRRTEDEDLNQNSTMGNNGTVTTSIESNEREICNFIYNKTSTNISTKDFKHEILDNVAVNIEESSKETNQNKSCCNATNLDDEDGTDLDDLVTGFQNHAENALNNINRNEISNNKTKEVEDSANHTSKILVPGTEDSDDLQSMSLCNNDTIPKENHSQDVIIKGVIIPESENQESLENSEKIISPTKTDESEIIKIEGEDNDNNKSKSINSEKGKSNDDNTNPKVKNESGINKMDDFDAKIAELERKALKKFKGTILDSIF